MEIWAKNVVLTCHSETDWTSESSRNLDGTMFMFFCFFALKYTATVGSETPEGLFSLSQSPDPTLT